MIRVATFNVENLFDRMKIINLLDNDKSSVLLKAFDDLQREINKIVYDKKKIEELLIKLNGYVTIRTDSGKFFKGFSKTKIIAKGKKDWTGGIDLVKEKFDNKQRENTANLIKNINPDIMCLVEVEGRQTLCNFMNKYFNKNERLDKNMLIDSPIDPRGIDIAVACKNLDIGNIRSNAYDLRKVNGKLLSIWSRDCLEVELKMNNEESIYIIANHFKSKMGGDTPEVQDKRLAQTNRLIQIINDRYDLKKQCVIVMGDLNDIPNSTPIKPLYKIDNLYDVFNIKKIPQKNRWTYYYHKAIKNQRQSQLDYIFVSKRLKESVMEVNIHREGMSAVAQGYIKNVQKMTSITDWTNAASDHAAISVDLDL